MPINPEGNLRKLRLSPTIEKLFTAFSHVLDIVKLLDINDELGRSMVCEVLSLFPSSVSYLIIRVERAQRSKQEICM